MQMLCCPVTNTRSCVAAWVGQSVGQKQQQRNLIMQSGGVMWRPRVGTGRTRGPPRALVLRSPALARRGVDRTRLCIQCCQPVGVNISQSPTFVCVARVQPFSWRDATDVMRCDVCGTVIFTIVAWRRLDGAELHMIGRQAQVCFWFRCQG